MFNKLYEAMYLKVLVNILITPTQSTVYIEMLNGKEVVDSTEEVFDTNHLNEKMHEHIVSYIKETPFFYISILDNSSSQGAIPTCAKQEMKQFYDISASEYKCYSDKWTYYTAKSDIYEIEKRYEKIGVDFIFSPFVILANFFQDKINSNLAMFILVEENTLSLSVFNNSELLYGDYLDIKDPLDKEEAFMDDMEDDIDLSLDEDEEIDLGDIDTIDELDDFGDIEDLDSIEEIDEFADSKDLHAQLEESQDKEEFPREEEDALNEDYQRFVLIQNSINNFYKDKKFSSAFIENVYIADYIGVSGDLKKYLEEEMFLNVYVRHIDLLHEICDSAKMELE